jgi:transposase InsO family protein
VNEEEVLHVSDFPQGLPITSGIVARESRKDPILSKVIQLTMDGWPNAVNNEQLQPYFRRRHELSLEKDCLLWGNRVVVPGVLRANLLLDLHQEHMGAARMKARARMYFWWPKLNEEVEDITKQCIVCQENARMPEQAKTAMWDWPAGPWRRLHIDYAGPYMGKMFLVVIDSYSKWLEVFSTNGATSDTTISLLRKLFAVHGFPEHIVSDNGTQFTSAKFEHFLLQCGIKHTTTAPGHPATNGMAERYVGFIKQQLKKMPEDLTLEDKLNKILLAYRTTPHTATSETPSNLLMKRQLRTRLSLIRPSLDSQQRQERFDNNLQCEQSFVVGDLVFVLNLRNGPRWLPGVIVEAMQRNYHVQVGQQVWKRHEDQLRRRYMDNVSTNLRKEFYIPPMNMNTDEPKEQGYDKVVPGNDRETTGDLMPGSIPVVNHPERETVPSPARQPTTVTDVGLRREYPVRENRGVKPTYLKDYSLEK